MIARVLILDQVTFSMILTEMGIPDALEKILTTWLNEMPVVARSHEKKLLALALTSLITVSNDIIFDNFSSIMTNVSETLNDITNEDEQSGAKVEYVASSLIESTFVMLFFLNRFLILADDNEDEIGMIMHGYGFIDTENLQNETPHYDRCKKVCLQDPIHVIVLKDYLQSQVGYLRSFLL